MSADVTKPKQIARRNKILNAALDVFSRDGFASAKMDDVAFAADVSKGTLYLYFDSKEDLFFEVVRSRITSVLDRVEHMTFETKGLSASELLTRQIQFAYSQLGKWKLKEVMHLIVSEGPRFPRIVQYYYETVVRRAIAMIQQTLEYGVSTGEFSGPVSEHTVRIIIAPTILLGIWRILFDDLDPIDEAKFAAAHLDVLLKGVLTQRTPVTA